MSDSDSDSLFAKTPFSDWALEPEPWSLLEQKKRRELWLQEIHVYDTECKVEENPEFTIRKTPEMVADFFDGKQTIWPRLCKNADRWILWAVTQGRLRMNRKKHMFMFTGDKADILSLKFGSENCWQLVNDGWGVVADVTEACNELYAALDRKLTNPRRTRLVQQKIENFKNMPEFVQFQSHRGHAHKKQQARYSFIGDKLGGNKGIKKPAAPEPNGKHSVHRMLMDYSSWLPDLPRGRRVVNACS